MSESHSPRGPADNDTFVLLIRTAREGGEIGTAIRRIISLDSPDRKSLINEIVGRMRARNEADDLIEAVEYLFNNEIADRIRESLG